MECSLEKNERTNISKNSKMQFRQKMNEEIFRKSDECSFRKKRMTKHFENKQNAVLEIELQNTNGQTF